MVSVFSRTDRRTDGDWTDGWMDGWMDTSDYNDQYRQTVYLDQYLILITHSPCSRSERNFCHICCLIFKKAS